MSSFASYYYTSRGPLGIWTPLVAVLLNVIGIALGVAVTRIIGYLSAQRYDLDKLPSPPVGDLVLGHVKILLRPDCHRVILEWTRQYGSMFRLRILNEWTVVITDPTTAAQVLAAVPGRTHNYKLIDEVLGGPGGVSMFGTLDEAHWHNVRKTTAPAFSMANVRRYYGGVLSSCGELLTSLEREQRALGCVDVEPHLQRLTLRAMLEGLLEVPDASRVPGFDSLATNILMLMAEANTHITDPIRAAWYGTPLAPLLSKHFARCRQALREVVAFHTNTAARLLARPPPSSDDTLLWACLHRLRHHTTGRRLTPVQLRGEVGMFTTAGFDTTASTVGWCLYAAALYPQQQEGVAGELRAGGMFGLGAVVEEEGADGGAEQAAAARLRLDPRVCPTPDGLARLPVLNAFVNEVMRLYPAAAISGQRTSDRPVRLMGLTLPPKVVLWPIVYGIHMSGRNWDEPEAFRPERWLRDPHCSAARREPEQAAEGEQQQPQGQPQGQPQARPAGGSEDGPAPRRFLPFGEGPKNCVGQNFGITVVRAVTALLLSRYRVALHPDMHPGGDLGAGTGMGGVSPADTALLTQVAVTTKLRRLRLVLTARD